MPSYLFSKGVYWRPALLITGVSPQRLSEAQAWNILAVAPGAAQLQGGDSTDFPQGLVHRLLRQATGAVRSCSRTCPSSAAHCQPDGPKLQDGRVQQLNSLRALILAQTGLQATMAAGLQAALRHLSLAAFASASIPLHSALAMRTREQLCAAEAALEQLLAFVTAAKVLHSLLAFKLADSPS